MVSDEVPCNNGKDCRYIVGYQVDGVLIPLFIKTPRDIFSYGVSLRQKGECLDIKRFGIRYMLKSVKTPMQKTNNARAE